MCLNYSPLGLPISQRLLYTLYVIPQLTRVRSNQTETIMFYVLTDSTKHTLVTFSALLHQEK